MAIPEAGEIVDWTEDGQGDDRPAGAPAPAAPASPAAPAARPAAAAAPAAAAPAPAAEEVDDGSVEAVEESRPSRVRLRHRAQSQQASPRDVPRIQQLTKKLRETEAELNRVRGGAPAPAAAAPAAATPPAAAAPPIRERTGPVTAQVFSKAEPLLEQFQDKTDPYAAWQRALASWDREKERHDADQAALVARGTAEDETFEQERQQIVDTYKTRLEAFKVKTPEFEAILQAAAAHSTSPVMEEAILRHDRGPEILLHLAKNPTILDDVFLATANTPVNSTTVATLQRRLSALLAAPAPSGTGSAAAPAVPPSPAPPNPVRTATTTPGDTMPGDEDSLEAHEGYFHANSRRRRR